MFTDLWNNFNKYLIKNNDPMELMGFDSYESFSNQLDTDLSFRHFVYDFLKEHITE